MQVRLVVELLPSQGQSSLQSFHVLLGGLPPLSSVTVGLQHELAVHAHDLMSLHAS